MTLPSAGGTGRRTTEDGLAVSTAQAVEPANSTDRSRRRQPPHPDHDLNQPVSTASAVEPENSGSTASAVEPINFEPPALRSPADRLSMWDASEALRGRNLRVAVTRHFFPLPALSGTSSSPPAPCVAADGGRHRDGRAGCAARRSSPREQADSRLGPGPVRRSTRCTIPCREAPPTESEAAAAVKTADSRGTNGRSPCDRKSRAPTPGTGCARRARAGSGRRNDEGAGPQRHCCPASGGPRGTVGWSSPRTDSALPLEPPSGSVGGRFEGKGSAIAPEPGSSLLSSAPHSSSRFNG